MGTEVEASVGTSGCEAPGPEEVATAEPQMEAFSKKLAGLASAGRGDGKPEIWAQIGFGFRAQIDLGFRAQIGLGFWAPGSRKPPVLIVLPIGPLKRDRFGLGIRDRFGLGIRN